MFTITITAIAIFARLAMLMFNKDEISEAPAPIEAECGAVPTNETQLLDYFAGQAMQVVLQETQETVPDGFWNFLKSIAHGMGATFLHVKMKHIEGVKQQGAENAYAFAAEMLKARRKHIPA